MTYEDLLLLSDQFFRDMELPELKQSKYSGLTVSPIVNFVYQLNEIRKPLYISVTAPAAGAEYSYTVPQGMLYKIVYHQYTFATDATVATRNCSTIIDDGVNQITRIWPATDHVASTTRTYYGIPEIPTMGLSQLANNLMYNLPFRSLWLEPGFRIRSSTTNLQAGDAYSSVTISVERMRISWP